MNENKETQNSFFRAFLKSSLESVGSNAKINDSDEDDVTVTGLDDVDQLLATRGRHRDHLTHRTLTLFLRANRGAQGSLPYLTLQP